MHLINDPGSGLTWGPGNPLPFFLGGNPTMRAPPPLIDKLKAMLGRHGCRNLGARDASPGLLDPNQLRLKAHKHVSDLLQDTLLTLVFVFMLLSREVPYGMFGPMVGSIIPMP